MLCVLIVGFPQKHLNRTFTLAMRLETKMKAQLIYSPPIKIRVNVFFLFRLQ